MEARRACFGERAEELVEWQGEVGAAPCITGASPPAEAARVWGAGAVGQSEDP